MALAVDTIIVMNPFIYTKATTYDEFAAAKTDCAKRHGS